MLSYMKRHALGLVVALAIIVLVSLGVIDPATAAIGVLASTSINSSFVRQYESEVHNAYQRNGTIILNMVRRRDGVVGTSTDFPVIGKGTATTKARHAQITPMNQSHSMVTCTLEDFYAGDWVDKLDETKINHDERIAIAEGGAMALGRKVDDQLFTAMDSTTLTDTFAYTNIATIRIQAAEFVEQLYANDVPMDGQIYFAVTPHMWTALMQVEQFASSRYVSAQPYMAGFEMVKWLGALWFPHSGCLGRGTATAKAFGWHKRSVGYANAANALNVAGNGPVRADITWHGDRASHFVNHMMSGGAALIDASGVIELASDDTATIPTS